ncbi:glycosyltransferase family 2 protein [Glutamicibacter arilaitensis]|uniref:glycosyltransferase family 2 protein n=2 Tax=Glutamicibacter arilaitensis TaxID=256701 RepID=UPI0018664428|nr:glycosyltransferase [Glutamicibacter arilaitensis]
MESHPFTAQGEVLVNAGQPPLISVIIPVYNSMPYLQDLLASLDTQTIAKSSFEVVIVNDGSTDSSPQVLDDYAQEHANVRVIHQENSGWAGKPRNVGMDHSAGQYYFFVDADDWLGAESLERIEAFILEYAPDVLAPRIVGVEGRRGGGQVFAETIVDASIDHMIKTLMPQKLIRAQLIEQNNIRFREDKVRLEDGMMLVQAYCLAKRNSILGDYDYYFLRARSDGANISSTAIDPLSYTESLKCIAMTFNALIDNVEYAKQLTAALFARKGLKIYRGQRFMKYKESKRLAWISAHREFLLEFLPDASEHFEGIRAAKVQCILSNDQLGLLRLAQQDLNEKINPALTNAESQSRKFILSVAIPDYFTAEVRLAGQERNGNLRWDFIPVRTSPETQTVEFEIPLNDLRGIVDLSIALDGTRLKRLVFPEQGQEHTHIGAKLYRTVNGYASIDARNIDESAWPSVSKIIRRLTVRSKRPRN